jgi:hypothetical protein
VCYTGAQRRTASCFEKKRELKPCLVFAVARDESHRFSYRGPAWNNFQQKRRSLNLSDEYIGHFLLVINLFESESAVEIIHN